MREENEIRYKRLFDQCPVPMFQITMDGVIETANDSFLKTLGIPNREKLREINALDLWIDQDELRYLKEVLMGGGRIDNREVDLRRHDGGVVLVALSACTLKNDDGSLSVEGSFIDITGKKLLEAETQQIAELQGREKAMTAVTRLAAGIAHDINNILAGIYGHAQVLKVKLGESNPQQDSVARILSSVSKASDIVQELLTFVGANMFELKPVDLNKFVGTSVEEFSKDTGTEDRLVTQLNGENITVQMDTILAAEVLEELLKNAVHASSRGEEVRIVTGKDYPGDGITYSFLRDPQSVCGYFSIIDQGPGMDEDTKRNLFEPYFSMEEFGSGAGIGMTRVYGIIRQHEGALEVLSEPGAGTTVIVFFPMYGD